jgi:hypothetical protein
MGKDRKGIEFEDQTQCLSQLKAWLLPKNEAGKNKTAHILRQNRAYFFYNQLFDMPFFSESKLTK